MSRLLLLLISCVLALPAAAQTQQTFTHNQTGANLRPLGYPVPLPVDSLTPVDGFRSYASINARLQSLAMESVDLSAQVVGTTHNARVVVAYVVSSPSPVDAEGRSKPAFFINATTHAREWGVPEVSTGLIERMVEGAATDGLTRYLLDNTRLVIVPVQNVDGFLQTQRFPADVLVGQDPRVPNDWPRDGRMRRKNMPSVDENLSTTFDHLFGVDLNRNHRPFWGTTTSGGQLTNIRDLTYRGPSVQSEPEVLATLAAAELGPVSRLRLGIDLHSHQRLFFSSNTGRSRLNAIQFGLISTLRSHHFAVPTGAGVPNGKVYTDVPDPPNVGIGVHAEYFAYQWLVPAWTLEIEPGPTAGQEYGGTADSHAGFVLPASQARRVREAWAESHLVAFYYMAGAPILSAVELADPQSLRSRWRSEWRIPAPGNSTRELSIVRSERLLVGERLSATFEFSKPMRLLRDGQPEALPGVSITMLPQIWRVGADGRIPLQVSSGEWIASTIYPGTSTAFRVEFEVPDSAGPFGFEVETTDLVGHRLDANPATPVDWSAGAWSGWDASPSGPAGDVGGSDQNTELTAAPAAVGQVPRLIDPLPEVVGEGDIIAARFVLDAPAVGRVEVFAEDPAFTRIRPTISPVPPPAPSIVWLDGESGQRVLKFAISEDVDVQGDLDSRLVFGLLADGQLFDFIDVDVVRLDNDRPGLPVINAVQSSASPSLGCCNVFDLKRALAIAESPGQEIEVVARSDRPLSVARNATRIVPITIGGQARVFGNGAMLVPGAELGAGTVFAVQPGGQLELDQLELLAGSGVLPGLGAGETPQPMLANAGDLRLDRMVVRSLGGFFSAVLGGPGQVRLTRSTIRPMVIPLADTTGSLTIESSTVQGTQSDGGVLRLAGAGRGDWLTLFELQTVGVPLFATQEAGTLRWTGTVLQNLRTSGAISACVGNISSGGFNVEFVESQPQCVGEGEGDRILPAGPLIGTPPPVTFVAPWRLPAVLDSGGSCPQVDQRGAPRPQTATPDVEARCDAGAVEAGVNPYRGIWQPERSGHGVDIQTAGNQLLLAWYTYDDDGQPTAYQAAGPLTGKRWNSTLLRSSRDPDSGTVLPPTRVGSVAIDFETDTRATLRWRFDAKGIDGSESIEASLFDPSTPAIEVTGLWFPPEESGYGATITRRGATTAVGIYYYDASGALRWALGTGGGESADVIDMISFTGFCPDCSNLGMPFRAQEAGRVLYHFLTPRRARLDIDLTYPGAAGGRWLREEANFVPLNDPVDNREVISARQP